MRQCSFLRIFDWQYPFSSPANDVVKHLKGKNYVKWPKKLFDDQKAQRSGKYCAFHKGLGNEIKECRFFRVEVETLVRIGYLKEVLLTPIAKQGPLAITQQDQGV